MSDELADSIKLSLIFHFYVLLPFSLSCQVFRMSSVGKVCSRTFVCGTWQSLNRSPVPVRKKQGSIQTSGSKWDFWIQSNINKSKVKIKSSPSFTEFINSYPEKCCPSILLLFFETCSCKRIFCTKWWAHVESSPQQNFHVQMAYEL